MKTVSLLLVNARQMVTCAADAPKRGSAMRDVGLIENGAVAIQDSQIVAAGTTDDIRRDYTALQTMDVSGRVLCPGFVDAHTHTVYAGSRVHEFELRIQGASYMEIMAAGGGIVSTMRATREATLQQLLAESKTRLDEMFRLGTTTVEIKTGYGLDTATELKMLDAIAALDMGHRVDIVPTFLGAHAVPPEYRGRTDEYIDLVVHEMLPSAAEWYQRSHFAERKTPFYVDVFCEDGVLDVEQTRRVLEAGQALGMSIKAHVDEFKSLGGVTLAIGLNAVSVDHLDATEQVEIEKLAASNTIGVVLPAVNFNLGSAHFARARAMLDAGAAVALATDINPGSAPCPSMPLVMAIACRYQKFLPAEALNASTINAAYAMGMGAKVGSIQPGKQADMLILNVPDYRQIMYQFGGNPVETVIKRGAIV